MAKIKYRYTLERSRVETNDVDCLYMGYAAEHKVWLNNEIYCKYKEEDLDAALCSLTDDYKCSYMAYNDRIAIDEFFVYDRIDKCVVAFAPTELFNQFLKDLKIDNSDGSIDETVMNCGKEDWAVLRERLKDKVANFPTPLLTQEEYDDEWGYVDMVNDEPTKSSGYTVKELVDMLDADELPMIEDIAFKLALEWNPESAKNYTDVEDLINKCDNPNTENSINSDLICDLIMRMKGITFDDEKR